MGAPATGLQPPTGAYPRGRRGWRGYRGKLAAGVVALLLATSAVFPLVVVFLGVLLVALVALDSAVPGLVPGLRSLFRVPLAPASRRRARLLLAGSVGVVLIVCGTTGAKLSGRVRTEWKLHESQRLASEERAGELLKRAREHLAAGEVELAELTLMDVDRIATIAPQRQREIDELLARIRRAGDSAAILAILLQLPPDEFEALAGGISVPAALEFEERALTRRAVDLARSQLEEARARRARP